MTVFTIDDVRETMPAEVERFLRDIESANGDLLAQPALAGDHCWRGLRKILRTVAARGHAIAGTSSLVSAESLASSARLIESLAAQADIELREARERAARARRALELIPEGVQRMREVLALELKHSQDEAQWAAAEWQGSVEGLLNELGEVKGLVAKASTGLNTSLPPNGGSELPAPVADEEPPSVEPAPEPTAAEALVVDFERIEVVSNLSFEEVGESPQEVAVDSTSTPRERAPSRREAPTPASAGASAGDATASVPGAPEGKADEGAVEEGEFSFTEIEEDAPQAPSSQAKDPVQLELEGVFQQEAREAIVALQGHLSALLSDPSSRALALPIERTYHTLKGAAATVGLTEVSARAADLQLRAERASTDGTDAAGVAAFIRDTNEMLALAGLTGIALAPPPKPSADASVAPGPKAQSAAERAIRQAFLSEAQQLHEEASTLVAALSLARDDAPAILEKLARLFHRLKGSALVAAEDSVAETAVSLEKACASSPAPTTAELSLGLARVASKLGLATTPRKEDATPLSEDPGALAAIRAAFEVEARQIVEEALTRVQHAESTSQGSSEASRDLRQLLHRLQGSARIVGENAIAHEARALEELSTDLTKSPDALAARLQELRSRLGESSSLLAPSEACAAAGPRRERVELTAPDELWETFTLECSELLDNIERSALALEETSQPKEHLRTLMRSVHTLKGVVNTTGLSPTGKMLHRIEDFLEALQGRPILPPMRTISSLLLWVHGQVRRHLKEARTGWIEVAPEQLEHKLAGALSAQSEHGTSRRSDSRSGTSTGASERSDASASARSGNSDISEARGADRKIIRVSTDRLDTLMNLAGELVVNRSRLNSRVDRLRSLQVELVRGSRRLFDTVDAFREDHEFANLDGRHALALTGTDEASSSQRSGQDESAWAGFGELELDHYEGIHILTRRLAELTNDFSELHGQLSQGIAALTDDSDVVGGIVTGIQTEVTRARMVPLESLFLRLRLPLRDAANREQKEVRDIVRGEEVPVDKTIADTLFQPMLHLVRNAVVHGIESPSRREGAGKNRAGTIELSARQESGQIVIEVRDDGAGLNYEALRARGIAMGVLPPDTPADDPRVADMVFVPGLSTRSTAGDVAGRGVGGDVVKRTVDRLNGSIHVASQPGRGTTFTIRLPLTLAITRALIVRQGKQAFAIPLHFAGRILDVHEQEVVATGNLRRVKADGALLPVRPLSEFLGVDGAGASEGPVVMLRVGERQMALQIDAIVAHEDIVVKNLGELLTGHPLFSGINIRGTGELVLIIDVPALIEGRGTTVRQAPTAPVASEGAPAKAREREAERVAKPHRPATPTRPARVMFVDDSLSVRKVAEMHLKELGAEVMVAVDGLDAIAKLREHEIDIVFTDLEMPRMHGYELIRELRFLPAFKDLPIIVVSSRSGQKHQDQAKQLGANEYLTKPFTVQMLGAVIKKWVSGHGQSSDSRESGR